MNLTVFDIVYVVFILLLFAGVIFCGVKPLPALDGQEACQRLNNLRGIFAMEIVVGHVIRDDRTLLYPMGKFMIISVAFFFFVSAFGLVGNRDFIPVPWHFHLDYSMESIMRSVRTY
ncbi:MAG: hypothetical protein PUC12_17515 [Clostridiales bacterium]|nr:hypothetical protein [Clostridiales bacterium]